MLSPPSLAPRRATVRKQKNHMYRRIGVLIASTAFTLAGCGPASPPEQPAAEQSPPAATAGGAEQVSLSVARAILSNPARSEDARARDSRSKPEIVLGLLDLKPGQHAIDIFGGAGYYADMMAAMVGPTGRVILHNNTPYHQFVADRVTERYIDHQVPGVRYLKSEVDDLKLEPLSLDAALMVLSYHDLYFFSPQRGWGKTDVSLFFSQLREALRPGGRLVVVDHAAVEGTGSDAAQELHRIDEAFAIQDIERNGFRLLARSDALRNPDDDHTSIVFDPEFRGATDRFILLFEKT